jgi:DNA segregation ATPase FtsK/SpoIIIE-like protein
VLESLEFELYIKCINCDKKIYELTNGESLEKKSRVYMKKKNPKKKILISDVKEKLIKKAKEEGLIDKVMSAPTTKEKNIKDINEYLELVKEYIKGKNTIYISRIQADFTIGYAKAKTIVEQLVADGLLVPLKSVGYKVNK